MIGSDSFSSYKDDPERASNGTTGSSSSDEQEMKSAMNFRMKPETKRSKKPEFDGDFL
jgi:hypothetical protein